MANDGYITVRLRAGVHKRLLSKRRKLGKPLSDVIDDGLDALEELAKIKSTAEETT